MSGKVPWNQGVVLAHGGSWVGWRGVTPSRCPRVLSGELQFRGQQNTVQVGSLPLFPQPSVPLPKESGIYRCTHRSATTQGTEMTVWRVRGGHSIVVGILSQPRRNMPNMQATIH